MQNFHDNKTAGREAVLCPYVRQMPDSLRAAAALTVSGAVTLRQPWRAAEQAEFRPATARVFWTDTALGVLAELEDDDIFNAADGENQRCWRTGDVLELFLRVPSAATYWEFHVTPENHRLQLRYPGEEFFRRFNVMRDDWLREIGLPPRSFWSETEVLPAKKLWRVRALLPWELFGNKPRAGDAWLVNICRYDYTRGGGKPVLSTIADGQRPDFHNNSAWRALSFQ